MIQDKRRRAQAKFVQTSSTFVCPKNLAYNFYERKSRIYERSLRFFYSFAFLGTQCITSPFLLLTLLLAKQKKSESPAAATERHRDFAKCVLVRSKNKFGSGRFRGRSTNSPSLWLALRVLRFASQRNCDPTPKTRLHAVPVNVFWL